jgi:hypothetical protein
MAARDRFTIPLECPRCKKTGEAECSQEDGWAYVKGDRATAVTAVSPGFARVKTPSGYGDDVNFVCDECGELSAK